MSYIMQKGDYVAHVDSEIIIIWEGNHHIFVYNQNGDLIDSIRDPDILFVDDVQYIVDDYLNGYYAKARTV